MTFKVIVPHVLSDYVNSSAGLVNNIVDHDAVPEITGQTDWSSGSIAAGAIVSIDAVSAGFTGYQFERRVYQNVSDTAQTPADEAALAADTANFVFLGPENFARPFDVQVGLDQERVIQTQADSLGAVHGSGDGQLFYEFAEMPPIQGVAFFNMDATFARIYTDDVTTNEIYYFNDEAPIASDYYEFHIKPPLREKSLVATDLNLIALSEFNLSIRNEFGAAKAGSVIFGHVWDLGVTLMDAERSSRSTSFVQFNNTTTSIVRRMPRNGIDLQVKVESGREKGVQRILDDLEGVSAVFIPDEVNHPGLTTYGVLRGVSESYRYKQNVFLTLRVEGL